MGDKISFAQMSNVELQNHIHRVSQDSGCVFFTMHAQERMLQRSVSDIQVLD